MDGDVSMTVAEAIDAAVKQSKAKYVAAEIPATTFNNTQYVINHNLNTTFVDVSVQVKTGGIWTFDLVVVQVDSANAVTVTLASPAEGIRYVVHGYDAGDYIAVTPTTHTQPAPNDLGQ
jgi:HAMP domain-containing protein